jgi:hypothetical protein
MTGRTNSYNANVSSSISSFDDDIGFVAGLPVGTRTLATAFKEYGESIGKPYTAHYNGKWGIGVRLFVIVLDKRVHCCLNFLRNPLGHCVDEHCHGYGI